MNRFSRKHLTDEALLKGLEASVERERDSRAKLVALIAEIDARKMHVAAGYSSLREYCVRELRVSEDTADELIQAHQESLVFDSSSFRVRIIDPPMGPDSPGLAEITMDAAMQTQWLRLRELLTEEGRAPSDGEILEKLLDFLIEELLSQERRN